MSDNQWVFDATVANRFDEIARTNIPNYEVVIQKSLTIATRSFPDRHARVIDVGSALGHTLEVFRDAGFTDVFGVDNAQAMIANSRVRENLILADTFPQENGPFDVIIANWTLHFIVDPSVRATYIRDIFESLTPQGVFILTEKMQSDPLVHEQYMDFKRSMGLSDTAIREKTDSLVGVLTPLPIEWYIDTLRGVGFNHIDMVDAAWCFNTFVCKK